MPNELTLHVLEHLVYRHPGLIQRKMDAALDAAAALHRPDGPAPGDHWPVLCAACPRGEFALREALTELVRRGRIEGRRMQAKGRPTAYYPPGHPGVLP